jgi:hypothetical protein
LYTLAGREAFVGVVAPVSADTALADGNIGAICPVSFGMETCMSLSAFARQRVFRSGLTVALLALSAVAYSTPRPAVIELFTSQGCSSCPPAEAYLGQVSKRPDVIALAFHVTYWDDLGWRDRFALTDAVARQNGYARNLRRSTVYTPQLIVDGLDDRAGTSARLTAAADGVPVDLSISGSDLRVEVGVNPDFTKCEVTLVSYLRHAVSAIGRGENTGRKLEEFNIVRSIRKLGEWRGDNVRFSVAVGSLPADATDVAVLVQGEGQRAIVGAATRAVR